MGRRKFYFDLAERTGWTFAQAFAGMLLATQAMSLDVLEAALYAGIFAVCKGIVASQFGSQGTASSLPEKMDPQFGARRDR